MTGAGPCDPRLVMAEQITEAQHDTTDTPYLTENAAAARSTLAARTLQHLRKNGGGPPFAKLGKRIVYRREDLDRWIADRVTNTGSKAAP